MKAENTIERYFLGQLSEKEKEEIEERLMVDMAFLNEALMKETELIDCYLERRFSDAEKECLESFLSSPRQFQKLRLTVGLRKRSLENEGNVTKYQSESVFSRFLRVFGRHPRHATPFV